MKLKLIQDKIHEVRGYKVMLDYDLADLYEVETKRLNEAVKRNVERFPPDFMFKLTVKEWEMMRSQFATASQKKRNVNITPYAFTEHGVTMLASVLRSGKAVKMNIAIVRAFIALRQFAINYANLAREIEELKAITGNHNGHLNQIYKALENLMDQKQEEKKWEDRERIGFITGK